MAAADFLSHPDRVWSEESKWTGGESKFHLGYRTTPSEIDARGSSANYTLLGYHSLSVESVSRIRVDGTVSTVA
jgi:hypothetical protein